MGSQQGASAHAFGIAMRARYIMRNLVRWVGRWVWLRNETVDGRGTATRVRLAWHFLSTRQWDQDRPALSMHGFNTAWGIIDECYRS